MIVKVCGVTTVDDALAAAEAGADWIGLNFWPGSPRRVDVERARAISRALAAAARTVGVFVDAARAEIERTIDAVGLDLVQLHGDEPPEEARRFGDRAVKALRLRERDRIPLYAPARILLDADVAVRGGSGVVIDWAAAREVAARHPVILAGGLRPENVGRAVREVRPAGVDAASGVERAPGVKDAERVRAFVREARAAAAAPEAGP